MGKHFREWGYQDCEQKVESEVAATVGEEAYTSNYLYIEKGDHWQEGKTYPIHHPDKTIRDRMLAAAKPLFTPVPILRECVDAEGDALLEKEPTIELTHREPAADDSEERKRQDENAQRLRAALSSWWDDAEFWDSVRDAVRYSSWGARGGLRRRLLPSAFKEQTRLGEGGQEETVTVLVDGLTLKEALARIHVSAPLPDAALLYRDPETRERAAIILTSSGEGTSVQHSAEVWYTEERGTATVTVRRIVSKGGTEAREEVFPQMEGRLPLAEIRAPLLVTEPARQQQRARDYAETILMKTLRGAGSRERYLGNVEPALEWTQTKPEGEPLREFTDNRGTWYGVPKPIELGDGMLNYLTGLEVEGEGGRRGYSTVQVEVEDPVDPAFVTKAAHHIRATLLETCFQAHALEADKGAESGYSKKQSRARFEKRVKRKKIGAELMIAETLTGVLRDAALMAEGDELAALVAEYRVSVTLHVDTGPLTPDETREVREGVKALLLPRPDGMAAAGVEDTQVGHEAIMADPIQRLEYRKLQGEVFSVFYENGTLEGAITAAEIPEDLAEKLRQTDAPSEVVPQ